MISQGILHALMQLFAAFAAGRSSEEAMLGRQAASRYLRGRVSGPLEQKFLGEYDNQLERLTSATRSKEKQLARISVKLLRTCTEINKELDLKERALVLVRLAEFARKTGTLEGAESFTNHVSEGLHLPAGDVLAIRALVLAEDASPAAPLFQPAWGGGGDGVIAAHIPGAEMFFVKAQDTTNLRLNGQVIQAGSVFPMGPGSVLKTNNGVALFFSDLVRMIVPESERETLHFQARDIAHYFRLPDETALHPITIEEGEGRLVGIMGASGSGKSTLLSILNGTTRPTYGTVTLNGCDVHDVHDGVGKSSGPAIGHIAQEDVLIPELSVRQNLLYSAQLSFPSRDGLEERVDSTLTKLGLWDIRELRVGSVMDKTISGGQRKRLNIALELVREPRVLFVDEPTSGLSSRDSEQIMDLLKELALRGKLIFVVIHQPSSEIFQLFDRLLLLDQGGYPIYDGAPTESFGYFKRLTNQVDQSGASCAGCGHVNPEELFNMIEARMVDEWGHMTAERRVQPEAWNDFYHMVLTPAEPSAVQDCEGADEHSDQPSWWNQLRTYFQRDTHTKRLNRQYLLINVLEAPLLAGFLALFSRFQEAGSEYTFLTSENLPQFLFISVIVALFLGLSLSAEEILRDRPMLRRERFLRLKWSSYLSAKLAVMLGITALQSLLYAFVSVLILEIHGGLFFFFATLFSVGSFGTLLGLNISSAFRSAKVIYIIIPLLIIPQIIFGGAIVRFDRFNPALTSIGKVPLIGQVMASRWGFEALMVAQARWNDYDARFAEVEDVIERAAWRRDFWSAAMGDLETDGATLAAESTAARLELKSWGVPASVLPAEGAPEGAWRNAFAGEYIRAFRERDSIRRATPDLGHLKDRYSNASVNVWVGQSDRIVRISESNGRLLQRTQPIRQAPLHAWEWNRQLYVPAKAVAGQHIPTPLFNLGALWLMSILAWIALRFRWLGRLSKQD